MLTVEFLANLYWLVFKSKLIRLALFFAKLTIIVKNRYQPYY